MKYKVSDLEGALLDAAVAKAEGWHIYDWGDGDQDWRGPPTEDDELGPLQATVGAWLPSTEWVDGGPIIERERIAILPYAHDDEYEYDADGNNPRLVAPSRWWAEVMAADESGWIERCPRQAEHHPGGVNGYAGHTPLIAAMRAFVASRLGEEVEL